RQSRISSRSRSGCIPAPPTTPRPPAFETAAASSARATKPIPAEMTGCSIPRRSQILVRRTSSRLTRVVSPRMSVTVGVEVHGHVGLVELQRPPHNFFTVGMIEGVADALETFDRDTNVRAAVLAAQGRSFCAGADFGGGEEASSTDRL